MAVTLAELAKRFHCELRGDAGVEIDGVASLASAGPRSIAFVANPAYLSQLAHTQAGAVLLCAADAAGYAGNVLITSNPHLSFARILAHLHPEPRIPRVCMPAPWSIPVHAWPPASRSARWR